jgi:hypothetical protein
MEHSSIVTSTIIRWTAPTDYENICWYKLFRITANDTALLVDSACIAQVPSLGENQYVDILPNLGESRNRWYALKSISYSNKSSAFTDLMSASTTSGVTINGGLVISGGMTVDTLTITGNTSVGGTFHSCGAATFGSTVTISGATSISNTLHVCGAVTLGNNLTISGNLTVGGNSVLCGNLTVSGLTSLNDLRVTGGATIIGTLTVDDLIVTGGISVHGNILVSASSVFGDALSVGGNLCASGTFHASGAATFGSDVSITGPICGNSTLSIVGIVQLKSSLTVSSSITCGTFICKGNVVSCGIISQRGTAIAGKVQVDSSSNANYLYSSGVGTIRVSSSLSINDGGDFITISIPDSGVSAVKIESGVITKGKLAFVPLLYTGFTTITVATAAPGSPSDGDLFIDRS